MSRKRKNNLHVETILVPTGNQALRNSGAMVGTGNSFNLTNNQLGVVSADHQGSVAYGSYLTGGETSANVKAIKVVLGTPYSSNISNADAWGLRKPVEESHIITAGTVRTFTGTLTKTPTYSAKLFTSFNAPLDSAEYKVYAEMRSRRNDRDFGRNVDQVTVSYITPEYTVLPLITGKTSHMLQNVLYKFNLQSSAISSHPTYGVTGNNPVLALGLNVAGGSGTTLTSIECGTSIDVMNVTRDGVTSTQSIVADATLVETISDWIASTGLTGASTIEVIDITDAGTAGQTGDVDAFLVMGLDQEVARAYDDIYSQKVRVDVELADAFRVEPIFTEEDISEAFDGYGSGRQWRIRYDTRAFGNVYNLQLTGHKDNVIEIDNGLDETKSYNAHIIDFYDVGETLTTQEQHQKRLVILVEATCACLSATDLTTIDVAARS